MSQIMAIDENGMVAAIESYDSRNDTDRAARRQTAANCIAERLGVDVPTLTNRGIQHAGYEWGPTTNDTIKIGMVEIAWGEWGYPNEDE